MVGALHHPALVDVEVCVDLLHVVVVVEKWASVPTLQAHLAAPHMAEYRQRVGGLVKKVTLQVLEPV